MSDIQVKSNIDLGMNQIKNLVLENCAESPITNLVEGRMIYNTYSKDPMVYNGTDWLSLRNVNLSQMYIDENNHLIGILSNGESIDAGEIPTSGSNRVLQVLYDNSYGAEATTHYGDLIGFTSPQTESGLAMNLTSWLTYHPQIIDSSEDYAIKCDSSGTGNWNNTMDIAFKTPVYLDTTSDTVVKIRNNTNNDYYVFFYRVDGTNPTFADIFAGTAVASQKHYGVYSQNYLNILCDPLEVASGQTFTAGYYYVVIKCLGGMDLFFLKNLGVYSNIPGGELIDEQSSE